ncbi:SigB/SigF/SigG family RNA polymerase sigma factor [Streptomyces sp. NPDC004111]|uniref:SigB/SigF/SigG family RNA polymerase sigma factor n=1 Tax=Streptomyces sp. NPDC004111 TaxID=3364690 RepID=UPI0036803616
MTAVPATAPHTPQAREDSCAARSSDAVRRQHDDAPDTGDLFLQAAQLEGAARERLLAEITDRWLPMAHRIAARYRNRGEQLEDLEQIAALGLVKAVNRFDPQRQLPFEVFAIPTITGEVKRHFRDHLWSVHVPRRIQQHRNQLRRARQELAELSGGDPTLAELATQAGLTLDEAREGLGAQHAFASLSLDRPTAESGTDFSLKDILEATETGYALAVDREAVKPLLRALPAREKTILYLRYFDDMTQADIARKVGLSQMHVSRILSRTCTRIRQQALLTGGHRPAHAA